MPARIRDKFPKRRKTRSVTVRVRGDLYLAVMEELRKTKHTFVEFIEASMVSFLEEVGSDDSSDIKDESDDDEVR